MEQRNLIDFSTKNLALSERAKLTKSSSEEELRIYFKNNWKGSKLSFAKEYNINGGNFSSWLDRKINSPASCKAVRNYIKNTSSIKKDKIEGEKCGSKWDKEEENKLKKEVEEEMTDDDIAKIHGRTKNAIRLKRIKMDHIQSAKNKDVEDIDILNLIEELKILEAKEQIIKNNILKIISEY